MAKENKCDFCGKRVEQVAFKIYAAPVLPGKSSTSFMSGYSHYADACGDCASKLLERMIKRQSRNNGSNTTKKNTKKKSAATPS